ncbi:MAG: hypothetical protein [Caudoviricetes sp.]|nr:MAG: hypothetical protein [Caudoviricetes sp.]
MKRDWELIRKIMLAIEASPCDMQVSSFSIKDYDPEIVGYHIKLLSDALLVEAINSSSDETMYEYYAQDLTLAGHEFLDNIRSDTNWNKIKTLIKSKGGELTFETIKAAASYMIVKLFS